MEKLGIEKVYASALIDVGVELGKLDLISEEIASLGIVLDDNPELHALLKDGRISKTEKHQIISNIFEGNISGEMLNFLFVIADNNRFYCFKDILKAYNKILDERNGLENGVVYSVKELGRDTLSNLEREIGKSLGESIKLENRIDSKLIGGIKVYVSGKIIDASYQSSIEKIRKSLLV